MFKLVVLFALVAVTLARPGYLGHYDHYETPLVYGGHPSLGHHEEYVTIQEPTVAKVGAIVESVPSAVSHQSQTVVHSKAHVVTPILAPAVKTYHTPIVHQTYAAPVIYSGYGYDYHDYHGHHNYHHDYLYDYHHY